MAQITNGGRKNIVEWSQHFHRGKVLPEVQMLAQNNMSVMDVPFVQCNDGGTHLWNLQTSLPTVTKTAYGEGTPVSHSQKSQLREEPSLLTGFASVEKELGRVGGQMGTLRAKEDSAFAEAMRQQFAQMQFYANRTTNQRDFYGFCTLYNSLTGTRSANVFSCGGATANAQTSIVGVNWGADVYGVFPEGTTAGLEKEDLGTQVSTLPSGNKLITVDTFHKWYVSLIVEAWQSVVRICNIQVADANALANNQAPTSFANILHKMVLAKLRIRRPGRFVWYCNDVVYGLMMRLGLEKSANGFTVKEAVTQFGTFEELYYLGSPVRRVDQILSTESVVS